MLNSKSLSMSQFDNSQNSQIKSSESSENDSESAKQQQKFMKNEKNRNTKEGNEKPQNKKRQLFKVKSKSLDKIEINNAKENLRQTQESSVFLPNYGQDSLNEIKEEKESQISIKECADFRKLKNQRQNEIKNIKHNSQQFIKGVFKLQSSNQFNAIKRLSQMVEKSLSDDKNTYVFQTYLNTISQYGQSQKLIFQTFRAYEISISNNQRCQIQIRLQGLLSQIIGQEQRNQMNDELINQENILLQEINALQEQMSDEEENKIDKSQSIQNSLKSKSSLQSSSYINVKQSISDSLDKLKISQQNQISLQIKQNNFQSRIKVILNLIQNIDINQNIQEHQIRENIRPASILNSSEFGNQIENLQSSSQQSDSSYININYQRQSQRNLENRGQLNQCEILFSIQEESESRHANFSNNVIIPAQMTDFSEMDCDELYSEERNHLDNQIQQFHSNGPFKKKLIYKQSHSNLQLFDEIVNPNSKQKKKDQVEAKIVEQVVYVSSQPLILKIDRQIQTEGVQIHDSNDQQSELNDMVLPLNNQIINNHHNPRIQCQNCQRLQQEINNLKSEKQLQNIKINQIQQQVADLMNINEFGLQSDQQTHHLKLQNKQLTEFASIQNEYFKSRLNLMVQQQKEILDYMNQINQQFNERESIIQEAKQYFNQQEIEQKFDLIEIIYGILSQINKIFANSYFEIDGSIQKKEDLKTFTEIFGYKSKILFVLQSLLSNQINSNLVFQKIKLFIEFKEVYTQNKESSPHNNDQQIQDIQNLINGNYKNTIMLITIKNENDEYENILNKNNIIHEEWYRNSEIILQSIGGQMKSIHQGIEVQVPVRICKDYQINQSQSNKRSFYKFIHIITGSKIKLMGIKNEYEEKRISEELSHIMMDNNRNQRQILIEDYMEQILKLRIEKLENEINNSIFEEVSVENNFINQNQGSHINCRSNDLPLLDQSLNAQSLQVGTGKKLLNKEQYLLHKEIGERKFSEYQMRHIRQIDQSNQEIIFNDNQNVIHEESYGDQSLQERVSLPNSQGTQNLQESNEIISSLIN